MDSNTMLDRLHEQCRVGRRVALLLAYLNEHGAVGQEELAKVMPGGIKGEESISLRNGYASKDRAGVFRLLPKGVEVLHWLIGLVPQPEHWRKWESLAKAKQISNKTK